MLLQLEGVTKSFPSGEGGTLSILGGVDLSIEEGEAIAIVGPSGCGKSTLLNVIGTLDLPTSGRVMLDGKDVAKLGEAERARVRAETLGFIFQMHHLLPQLTVLENVLVPALAGGGHADAATEERARTLLDRVGLSGRLTHRPGHLSGGECQRAAVVRALINRPKLLLADEPTGSLDRKSAESLGSLLAELNREEGVALIVVTHSPVLASEIGRVHELRDGSLTAMAPAS